MTKCNKIKKIFCSPRLSLTISNPLSILDLPAEWAPWFYNRHIKQMNCTPYCSMTKVNGNISTYTIIAHSYTNNIHMIVKKNITKISYQSMSHVIKNTARLISNQNQHKWFHGRCTNDLTQ